MLGRGSSTSYQGERPVSAEHPSAQLTLLRLIFQSENGFAESARSEKDGAQIKKPALDREPYYLTPIHFWRLEARDGGTFVRTAESYEVSSAASFADRSKRRSTAHSTTGFTT